MELTEFHEAFRAILGWSGHLDYVFRVHGQEFNSFRRITRSKALREFQLHRQEKFVYICDTLDLSEWDVRVLDIPGHDGRRLHASLPGRSRRRAAQLQLPEGPESLTTWTDERGTQIYVRALKIARPAPLTAPRPFDMFRWTP
jgi:hypothetical protein